MNYNTELQSNNTDLQSILDTINALPESGSGGIKSADVTVTQDMVPNTMTALTADSNDTVVTGTAAVNGDVSTTFDGINTKSATIPAGYTTGGTVSLTDDIDNEVDAQADLIAEIMSTLEGKAAGGGGNTSINMNTCTVDIDSDYPGIVGFYECVEEDSIVYACKDLDMNCTITNVRCDSIMSICQPGFYKATVTSGEILENSTGSGFIYKTPSEANSIVSITIETD